MSAIGNPDSSHNASQASKKKSNKKKKAAAKGKTNGDVAQTKEEEPEDLEEPETPTNGVVSDLTNGLSNLGIDAADESREQGSSNAQAGLDGLFKERDSLRAEVETLRKSLEQIRNRHDEELRAVQSQLEEAQGEKEHADTRYRDLLGKVSTIKSQLGERLKADAEELSRVRDQNYELEEVNRNLKSSNESYQAEIAKLKEEDEQRSKELSSLRNRMNLSQQNWNKEREDLTSREAFAREEFEAAKQAMQDWEILAMEERSIRESLSDRVTELEDQLSGVKEAYEKAASERETQALTVDGLQRALQDIQDARKRELRELVETSQAQVEDLRKQLQEVERKFTEAESSLRATQKELERALPFEKEVKEKNLLIGKLRHEAVILNDHLTKALRFLKKGNPEDNIDRQIVTNHFLHFLTLDRSDPKKFQVLQLIAALLNWTEEQREQAGLARPGGNSTLRATFSPFHRTPSTPALNSEFFPDSGPNSKESLAELWSNFLQQEAEGEKKASKSVRSDSLSTQSRVPS